MSRKRKASTVLEHIQRTHHVSQAVANELIKSYDSDIFKQAVILWIAARNHPLREVERPEFRALIAAVNKDAELDLY